MVKYRSGEVCAGKSRNIHRRTHQHAKAGKLNNVRGVHHNLRSKGSLRKLEQGTLNRYHAAGARLTNKIRASRKYARC
ncbi:hypothetical protein DMA12_36060 [Amycolatopsis balhimycina DSM 5908]|uniref:Uncharacterized protein n=1 Tax=Amycolatopsis balhimycina DSM 5908 TaxID=1081091 RepID=A0A428W3J6_AMYBA|nr:hypothetical protein [Amycolatopsis balhimycina]RSM37648.1 hypothetical protein DMA12_36060 [Amycolatopsis balhimycina DSM 5908]